MAILQIAPNRFSVCHGSLALKSIYKISTRNIRYCASRPALDCHMYCMWNLDRYPLFLLPLGPTHTASDCPIRLVRLRCFPYRTLGALYSHVSTAALPQCCNHSAVPRVQAPPKHYPPGNFYFWGRHPSARGCTRPTVVPGLHLTLTRAEPQLEELPDVDTIHAKPG